MWFNLRTAARQLTEQNIIGSLKANDVQEFLGGISDFQIYSGLNPDMPEPEIVQYTVDFMLDNAEKFKAGYRAYMVEFKRVFYVFMNLKVDDVVQRIKETSTT
jgi:hypothetical protein